MTNQAWAVVGVVAVAIWAWWRFYYFFRNPPRSVPPGTELIAASDGRIVYEELVDFDVVDGSAPRSPWDEYLGRMRESFAPTGRWRVAGTYLSIFDVHVVRAPAGGVVRFVTVPPRGQNVPMERLLIAAALRRGVPYPGRAYAAKNALVGMEIRGAFGDFPVIVVMMADWWIRQIEVFPASGASVQRGDVVGRIRMGSQVDVWVPADKARIVCAVGDPMRSGETTVGAWLS